MRSVAVVGVDREQQSAIVRGKMERTGRMVWSKFNGLGGPNYSLYPDYSIMMVNTLKKHDI